MVMFALLGSLLAVSAQTSRRPPHAQNVTMYALRPRGLALDIREKNSADAQGDLFFYLTDRLLAPYACRHSNNTAFQCISIQKVLETNDQVYTKLSVEVDGTFGGCPDGNSDCTQYSDCNPEENTTHGHSVQFRCSCEYHRSQALRSSHHSQALIKQRAAPEQQYWTCSDFVSNSKCYDMSSKQCTECALNMSQAVRDAHNCTTDFIRDTCYASYHPCYDAVRSPSTCAAENISKSRCIACAEKFTPQLEKLCSSDYLDSACRPPLSCSVVGKVAVSTRYCNPSGLPDANGHCGICADSCSGVWDHWKTYTSAVVGGIWYSTPTAGDCTLPGSTGSGAGACSWRVVETAKTVNASCVNDNVHRLVQRRGSACFDACAAPTNSSTDCWIECFFQTLLGRDPLDPERVLAPAMNGTEVVGAWLAGFESDDPARGGCPAV